VVRFKIDDIESFISLDKAQIQLESGYGDRTCFLLQHNESLSLPAKAEHASHPPSFGGE
jgi:hypothetical protein